MRVKAAVPLSQAFVDFKYCTEQELIPTGSEKFKLLCPFHDDHNPSLHIDNSRAIFRCFACGAAGSIIDLQMRKSGNQSVGNALRALSQRYPSIGRILKIQVPRGSSENASVDEGTEETKKIVLKKRLPRKIVITHTEIGKDVMKLIVPLYRNALYAEEFRPALDYMMEQRGFSLPTLRAFDCGFAPPSRTADFALSYLASCDIPAEHAVIAGVARQGENGSRLDLMKNRIVTPIKNAKGEVVSLAGRVIDGSKTKGPKYINGPETAMFKKSNILFGADLAKNAPSTKADYGYLVIVEGYMDAMMMFECSQGRVGCVATMGTALTLKQLHQAYSMLRDPADGKIIINFDSDDAGYAAVERMCENVFPCCECPHAVFIAFPPISVKDPDEFLSLTRRVDDYVAYLQKTTQPWYEWHGRQIVQREINRMMKREEEMGDDLDDEELTASKEAISMIEEPDTDLDFEDVNLVDRFRRDISQAFGAQPDLPMFSDMQLYEKKRARVSDEALDRLAEIVSRAESCMPAVNVPAITHSLADTLSRGRPEVMRIIYANLIERIEKRTRSWRQLSIPVTTYWMGVPPWLAKQLPKKKTVGMAKDADQYDIDGKSGLLKKMSDPAYRKRVLRKLEYERRHVIPFLESQKGERSKRLQAAPRRSGEEIVLQVLIFADEMDRLDCLQVLLEIMLRFEERKLPFWTSASREMLFDYIARVEGPASPEEIAAYGEGMEWWSEELEELFIPNDEERDLDWRSFRQKLHDSPIDAMMIVAGAIEEMAGMVQGMIAVDGSADTMEKLKDATRRNATEEARVLLAKQMAASSEMDRTKYMSPQALAEYNRYHEEKRKEKERKRIRDETIQEILSTPDGELPPFAR